MTPSELDALFAFVVAAAVAALLTPLTMRFARRVGAIDRPRARGLSDRETPLLGGIAIFVAAAVAGVDLAAARRALDGDPARGRSDHAGRRARRPLRLPALAEAPRPDRRRGDRRRGRRRERPVRRAAGDRPSQLPQLRAHDHRHRPRRDDERRQLLRRRRRARRGRLRDRRGGLRRDRVHAARTSTVAPSSPR